MWNSGSVTSHRSSGRMRTCGATASPAKRKLAWVTITPFGQPVVPDVYSTAAMSGPSTSSRARARGGRVEGRAEVDGVVGRPADREHVDDVRCHVARREHDGRESAATMLTAQPACEVTYATSSTVADGFVGTSTAPRWAIPKRHGEEVGPVAQLHVHRVAPGHAQRSEQPGHARGTVGEVGVRQRRPVAGSTRRHHERGIGRSVGGGPATADRCQALRHGPCWVSPPPCRSRQCPVASLR